MGIKELMNKIGALRSKLSTGDIVAYDGILPRWRISDSMKSEEQIAILAYCLGVGYDIVFMSKEEGREIARQAYHSFTKHQEEDPRRGGGD